MKLKSNFTHFSRTAHPEWDSNRDSGVSLAQVCAGGNCYRNLYVLCTNYTSFIF